MSRENSDNWRLSKSWPASIKINPQNVNDQSQTDNNDPLSEFSREDVKRKHNDQFLAPSSELQVDTQNSSDDDFLNSWRLPHASSSISPHRISMGNSQDTPFLYRADMPEHKDLRGGKLQSETYHQDLQPLDNNTLGHDSNRSEGRAFSPSRWDPVVTYADSQHPDSSYPSRGTISGNNWLPLPTKEIAVVGSRAVLECMTDSDEKQTSFSWTRKGKVSKNIRCGLFQPKFECHKF